MVQHRHSRIPIYREDMDHIVGIAYIRQLMAATLQGQGVRSDCQPGPPGAVRPRDQARLGTAEGAPGAGDQHGHRDRRVRRGCGTGHHGRSASRRSSAKSVTRIRPRSAKSSRSPPAATSSGAAPVQKLEDLIGRKFEGLESSTVAGLIVTGVSGGYPRPARSSISTGFTCASWMPIGSEYTAFASSSQPFPIRFRMRATIRQQAVACHQPPADQHEEKLRSQLQPGRAKIHAPRPGVGATRPGPGESQPDGRMRCRTAGQDRGRGIP